MVGIDFFGGKVAGKLMILMEFLRKGVRDKS